MYCNRQAVVQLDKKTNTVRLEASSVGPIDERTPADRLLEATIEAIDAGGEGAVRVQDIADAAGVQIPILYRKFGNREQLIQAAQVERLGRALDSEFREVRAVVDQAATAEQFRSLLDLILASLDTAERRAARWQRVNVIGSTYGRPGLAASVSQLQSRTIRGVADALRRPQQLGWLREGLDLEAFAAWFAGQTMGRIVIELGNSQVDQSAWNSISADAVRHVLLG
jgi:AcrR family transcriptional regulator